MAALIICTHIFNDQFKYSQRPGFMGRITFNLGLKF